MYGTCKFKGKEANKYLAKVGARVDLEDFTWIKDPAKADKVAAAVLEWAKDHGETASGDLTFSPQTCARAQARPTSAPFAHFIPPLPFLQARRWSRTSSSRSAPA